MLVRLLLLAWHCVNATALPSKRPYYMTLQSHAKNTITPVWQWVNGILKFNVYNHNTIIMMGNYNVMPHWCHQSVTIWGVRLVLCSPLLGVARVRVRVRAAPCTRRRSSSAMNASRTWLITMWQAGPRPAAIIIILGTSRLKRYYVSERVSS